MKLKTVLSILVVLSLLVVATGLVAAQATSKSLSTNITYLNFGSGTAQVVAGYLQEGGGAWSNVPAAFTSFTLAPNGGQAIHRQYGADSGSMADGSGAVVASSDQPLGAVVQIQAIGQDATSSAYSGITSSSKQYYVPLAMRKLATGDGMVNSELVIQNAGTSATDVTVKFLDATGAAVFTKNFSAIPGGSSQYYDLSTESSSNLPDAFYGSAVVEATAADGKVAVVVNQFAGSHSLQTFNAFSSADVGTTWFVPLFTSRLANNLSTPIAVQNLSGGSLAVDAIVVECTADAASGGSNFTMKNTSSVVNSGAYFFNPVTDMSIPAAWYGSCKITATGNVVAFVQMRTVGTSNAAAYEAINASLTGKTLQVPLIAKRLAGSGFSSGLTVQNLDPNNAATVTFTYVPSPDYVAGGGSSTNIVVNSVNIGAGASIIHNHRLATVSGLTMPDGWFGTVTVTSDRPVAGFVQLSRAGDFAQPTGDAFQAHNAFTTN